MCVSADSRKFKGLILSVQRVMNEINQDGESSSSRRSTPLFHVAGDSTILAIDTHRRSSPGTQGFNKGSTNVPGSGNEYFCVY